MDVFKTKYYEVEGWDTATGRPTRAGLEAAGIGYVADVLESKGRLGATAAAGSVKASAKTAAAVSIKASVKTAKIGKAVTLSGAVTAGAIGKNVIIYVKKPGKKYWTYASTRHSYKLRSSARWQYRYTFKKGMAKGTYQFKAVFLNAEVPTVAKVKLV
jgi:hypothetical protein